MAQLMPLPLTVSCFSKIQIDFTFLVPAHLWVVLEKGPLNGCVCVCVCWSWSSLLACYVVFTGVIVSVSVVVVLQVNGGSMSSPVATLYTPVSFRMGAGSMDYQQLSEQIELKTGAMEATPHLSEHHSNSNLFEQVQETKQLPISSDFPL